MSTRAGILFVDEFSKIYFYRHSDGYPKCTGADLLEFCKYYKTLRDNASQSSGWLVLWGAKNFERFSGYEWKVGNYEPCMGFNSDLEFVYVIDLVKMKLEFRKCISGFWDKPILSKTKILETHKIGGSNEI